MWHFCIFNKGNYSHCLIGYNILKYEFIQPVYGRLWIGFSLLMPMECLLLLTHCRLAQQNNSVQWHCRLYNNYKFRHFNGIIRKTDSSSCQLFSIWLIKTSISDFSLCVKSSVYLYTTKLYESLKNSQCQCFATD